MLTSDNNVDHRLFDTLIAFDVSIGYSVCLCHVRNEVDMIVTKKLSLIN